MLFDQVEEYQGMRSWLALADGGTAGTSGSEELSSRDDARDTGADALADGGTVGNGGYINTNDK